MVAQHPLRLNRELAARHLDVGLQRRRHRRQRLEQLREGTPPSGQHRIGGVTHVEPDLAVVRVHHRLDRVTEIADTVRIGLGVGITVAGGEAIEQPVLMLIRFVAGGVRHPCRDQVRLALEPQEGRQRPHPFGHPSPQMQPGGGRQRSGEQQPWLRQVGGRHQPLQRAVDRHAATAAVVGIDVQLPLWKVELPHLRGRNDVGRRARTEVEARPAHRQGLARAGIADPQGGDALHPAAAAQILDEEERQPIRPEGVHRRHGEAVAVSEHHVAVQPGA